MVFISIAVCTTT